MEGFTWLNKSEFTLDGDCVSIYAPPKSDFYCSRGYLGQDGFAPDSLYNAPFYFTDIEGDFVFKALVEPDFADLYDAGAIMVMKDTSTWAKACFELMEPDRSSVVSVVTRQTPDDALGRNIEGRAVWLQLARAGNSFAFHYSEDGERYHYLRFFTLPVDKSVRVGCLAQAPAGTGGFRRFSHISLERKTVGNLKKGC